MSYAPRPTNILPTSTSSYRQSSLPSSSTSSNAQSTALQSRITAKRAELENLRQLRDLSGALATQMNALEAKLATLRDGAESVACILANWDNVLRAIAMASTKIPQPQSPAAENLPTTLVRIPVSSQQNGDTQEQNGMNGG